MRAGAVTLPATYTAAHEQTWSWRSVVYQNGRAAYLGHILPDFGQQSPRAIRLAHVSIAPGRPCLAFTAAQGIRRYRDDRNGAQFRVSLDAARCFIAIEQRQLDIHVARRDLTPGRSQNR